MNILLIQLRRIGDVIVTTPVIEVLRRRFPEARIDFLVEPVAAPILEAFPGLTERLVFKKSRFWFWVRELRRRRYDWVFDFMNNPRTAQLTWLSGAPVRVGFAAPFWGRVYTHRVPRPREDLYAVQNKFTLLRRLNVEAPANLLPRLSVSAAEWEAIGPWWSRSAGGRARQRVAVMPRHRHAIRQWPTEYFEATLRSLLRAPDRSVLLVGGSDEISSLEELAKKFPERVEVVPPGSLQRAAAVLAHCDVAVTNDSGLMHLAVAVGTPTVTVYGPTSPRSWNPRQPPHRYVQAEGLDCLVCNRDRCPFGHECMRWVSPDRVVCETEAVLAGGRAL